MVYKCCVPQCSSGYEKNSDEEKKVSMHKFPNDATLSQKWIRRICREKSFKVTQYTRICSLHFTENDFLNERQDSNTARKRSRWSSLVRRILKNDAFPTIFANLPAYLSTALPPSRSGGAATSESRV